MRIISRGDSLAYRIDYRPVKKIRRAEKKHSAVPAFTALWLLVFIILVCFCWPEGLEAVRSYLHLQNRWEALESTVRTLQEGDSLMDAAEAFSKFLSMYGN